MTACSIGGKEQKVTYKKEENGYKSSLTYYAKGDRVTKQTADNVMPYSTLNVKTADEAKEKLKDYLNIYEGAKGIKHKVSFGDNAVTEHVDMDYTKIDFKKSKDLVGIVVEGDDYSKGVSLKNSIKLVKEQGYKEKK